MHSIGQKASLLYHLQDRPQSTQLCGGACFQHWPAFIRS